MAKDLKEVQKSFELPPLFVPLLVLVTVPVLLLSVRIWYTDSARYTFMYWNLWLGVIPLLLAWWLIKRLDRKAWKRPPQLLLTAGWLFFLPNSFYMITDFIHLRETYEVSLLYDVVMLMSFVVAGLILGFASLVLVHRCLRQFLTPAMSWLLVLTTLLASSFAIYLGRYSRWNTWDILLSPLGLFFDVSERIINPISNLSTYIVTAIFFSLLATTYYVMWRSLEPRR